MQDSKSEQPKGTDVKETSLLDLTTGRLQQAGRSLQILNRMILIGRVADGATAAALVDAHTSCLSELDVTGLLLLLPTGWAQIVEGPLAALQSVLKMLSDQPCVDNVKIAGFAEDVPEQHFSYWSSKELDVSRNNFAEIAGSAAERTLASILSELQIGFIKIGQSVGKLGRPELSAALDSWSTSFADCMPSNERISQLVFEDLVLDLAEFMSVYEAPVTPSTSDASVWPAPNPLLY